MAEDKIRADNGLNIVVHSWRPAGPPRAVVAIVPGFNAHSGYFNWAAEQLVADGHAVYSVDLRGRGKSEGERFYVEKVSDYVSDAGKMIAFAKSREPGLPVFLLGHSAGGVVATSYALDHQSDLAGLICESFAYKVPAPDFALSILKALSYVIPHVGVLKLKNADFSRDPKAVAAMDSDPLIRNETQPTLTVATLARADERLKRDFHLMKMPVLIIHGTEDKTTVPAGSREFYDKASSADKTLKFYEGYFHDPLNDLGKEAVIADIKSWIAVRLPK